jgi:hypothetical protein
MTETTNAYWVGVRGDLTSEQAATLHTNGLAATGQLRESVSRYGQAEWETLRTFVRTPGDTKTQAIERVATVLSLKPTDLIAYDAGMFT